MSIVYKWVFFQFWGGFVNDRWSIFIASLELSTPKFIRNWVLKAFSIL